MALWRSNVLGCLLSLHVGWYLPPLIHCMHTVYYIFNVGATKDTVFDAFLRNAFQSTHTVQSCLIDFTLYKYVGLRSVALSTNHSS